jgi:hypothetical protein
MKSKCKGLPVAGVLLGTLVSVPAHAQGLPVETGSHFPVALWALGAAVLGLCSPTVLRRTDDGPGPKQSLPIARPKIFTQEKIKQNIQTAPQTLMIAVERAD